MTSRPTSPRIDVGYLRRRPKRGEPAPDPPPATAPPTGQLTLSDPPPGQLSLSGSRAAAAAPAPPPSRPGTTVRSVARVESRAILTSGSPVVTLTRRQSAIGALRIGATEPGAVSAVWELRDGMAGMVSAAMAVTVSPEFDKCPIVELRSGEVYVSLRRVKELRRLLIGVAGPSPEPSEPRVVLSLPGGAVVESTFRTGSGVVAALAVYQVDGELVLRREAAEFPDLPSVARAYGFDATWTPPIRS